MKCFCESRYKNLILLNSYKLVCGNFKVHCFYLFVQTNTFQCVLATDGSRSSAIFLYEQGGIQWTTGDSSGGTFGKQVWYLSS